MKNISPRLRRAIARHNRQKRRAEWLTGREPGLKRIIRATENGETEIEYISIEPTVCSAGGARRILPQRRRAEPIRTEPNKKTKTQSED